MLKNIGSNWALNLLQILVLMQLTPFVLHALGPDVNGVWITIVSLTGYLRLLILGIPMAAVRSIAEHAARKDLERVNAAISTCVGICLGLGVAAILVGAALYAFFDAALLSHLGAQLTAEDLHAARIAYVIVSLQVAGGFVTRLPYGILDAHHDFVTRNAVMCGELLLRLCSTLVLLHIEPSLIGLAWVQVVSMVAEFLAAWALVRRRHPGVRFGMSSFDPKLVRGILAFSMFAMLLNVGTLLAFRTDALVISAFLQPDDVTRFDIGNKFFEPLTGFVIGIGAVVMPTATRLQVAGATGELREVLLKWSKISLSLVLCVGIYLLVLGPEFLDWWVGAEYRVPSGQVLQVLMISFLFYLPIRGVALPILMGLGLPGKPALALLAMGLINLVVSLALVKPLGILGVALGTAIPNVGFALAVLVFACRELGLGLREYAKYVVARPLVGVLAPLAVLLVWKHALGAEGLTSLVAAGLCMLAAFALVWIFFVYKDDPFVDLRGPLGRLLHRPAGGRGP